MTRKSMAGSPAAPRYDTLLSLLRRCLGAANSTHRVRGVN